MADIALGQILKADVRAVPTSTLLYACAGLLGAVVLTGLEIATRLDSARPIPPVAAEPAARDMRPIFAPPTESIEWIDSESASIAFSKSLKEFYRTVLWNDQRMQGRAPGFFAGTISSADSLWSPSESLERSSATIFIGLTPNAARDRLSAGKLPKHQNDRNWQVMVFGRPIITIGGPSVLDAKQDASSRTVLSDWKADNAAIRFVQ